MTFRKDINGLRAIAVIAVLLFHFKITGFSGGFTGVDVFFVISGYLMTGIIFSHTREASFSIINFYNARAKRIIPALAVLCIMLILFGLFYLQTTDFRGILRNIKYSLLFVSNIAYFHSSGYFDTPTQENWLVHTWSLSVEWQFYILYPVIVKLLSRLVNEATIKIILILTALASFTFTSILAHYNPSANFFLLPSRAWEMLAGGLVFLFPMNLSLRSRLGFELVGLFMVLMAIFYFNANFLWPSYYSMLPILGTMLILYGNRDSFITCNPVAQYIGKISYSIYLWHWPFAVFLYFCELSTSYLAITISFLCILVLSSLSYYFIEQHFTKIKNTQLTIIKYLFFIILSGAVITPIISSIAHKYPKQNNFNSYQTEATIIQHCQVNSTYTKLIDCELGSGKLTAILIGDSHAHMLKKAIGETNPSKTLSWEKGGCPTLNDVYFSDQKETTTCQQFNLAVKALLGSSYQGVPLIVINRYNLYINPNNEGNHLISFKNTPRVINTNYLKKYKEVFVETFCELAKNRPVYLVKPIPEMNTNIPRNLSMQQYLPIHPYDISITLREHLQKQQTTLEAMDLAQKQCGIKLLDPTPYLCPDGKNCLGSIEGKPLYRDNNHINNYGDKLIEPLFKDFFQYNK